MKRYRMAQHAEKSFAPGRHYVFTVAEEDENGEWVTLKDYKEELFRYTEEYESRIRELKNEIRRLKTSTVTASDGVIKVRDITECNCADVLFHESHDGKSFVSEWVCPRHGYKKR